MFKIKVATGIATAVVSALPAFAQSNSSTNNGTVHSLTLKECVELALDNNIDIKIQKFNPGLSRFDVSIAYAGYDPVLSGSYDHIFNQGGGGFDAQNRPIPTSRTDANDFSTGLSGKLPTGMTYRFAGDAENRYGVTGLTPFESSTGGASMSLRQPLLRNFLFDTDRLNIAVAKNRLKVSELEFQDQVMTVVYNVENAYYSLIQARENVKVQEKALELAERLFKENRKRVEVGAMAPLDEKQAEADLATRKADLITSQQTFNVQENVLKSLISDNFRGWSPAVIEPAEKLVAVPETFNLMDSWNVGVSQRPDLLQAKLDIERSALQLKYYKNQLLPSLDIRGGYGHTAAGREFNDTIAGVREGNRPNYSYGVVMEIPLSNLAARNRYKAGKLSAEQIKLVFKSREQTVLIEIDNAIKEAQSSYQRVGATRQARLYAEAALDAEGKKLESGKSTSFQVLQLQRDLTSRRSEEIRALADYNKAIARVSYAEGSTLDRKKIKVDVK